MLNLLYSATMLLWIFFMLPFVLFQKIVKGKKMPPFKERFFPSNIQKREKGGIWIHAVSFGEVRAASSLYDALQSTYPSTPLYVSCITTTGFEEARRLLPGAFVFYFPLDLRFVMKRLIRRLEPKLVLLIEGDYWFNWLTVLKKHKVPILVCSAKISETSTRHFKKLKFFSKQLFSLPSFYLAQSLEFKNRFEMLGVESSKISIIGNLKECNLPRKEESQAALQIQERIGLKPSDFLIIIGSTHEKEEALLLKELLPLMQRHPQLKVLIAPRHPERFESVAKQLEAMKIPYNSYQNDSKIEHSLILFDTMGLLSAAYMLAKLVILGGSFIEGVGGHNILEPVLRGVPVVFGPNMQTQWLLVKKITSYNAGKQLSLEALRLFFEEYLHNSFFAQSYSQGCQLLMKETGLPLKKTLEMIDHCLNDFDR